MVTLSEALIEVSANSFTFGMTVAGSNPTIACVSFLCLFLLCQ